MKKVSLFLWLLFFYLLAQLFGVVNVILRALLRVCMFIEQGLLQIALAGK